MADGGKVVVKIDGDSSGLERTLSATSKSAKSAASTLGHEYAKAGMTLSQGMSKAWAEVRAAQQSGTTIMINGVETIIAENEKLVGQKEDLSGIYDKLGDSAQGAADDVKDGVNGIKAGFDKLGDSANNAAGKVKAGMADIKAGIDLAMGALRQLGGVLEKGIDYNATIEGMQTSFEVMTGSAEKAAETVERLRVMGAETPFELADLAGTTQLLMQYGFTADEAIESMSMLGDISQGNAQNMNSIALAYAQMSSAGKVNLVDIRQMINGGFNPLMEISQRTGESMDSLYDRVSKGTLSVDEITESMRHATSEGGQFYQSMEKQSQTLNGQLSTLKDNTNQLLGLLTQGMSEDLRNNLLPMANNMVAELTEAFSADGIRGLVTAAGSMLPDLIGMLTGELKNGISGLQRWLPVGAKQLMGALPAAIRGAGEVIPQLTDVLFEFAGTAITELVAMLPELVPELLTGFGNMFESVWKGIDQLGASLIYGIDRAMHGGREKVLGAWVEDSDFEWNIHVLPEVTVESVTEQIDEARQGIIDALEGKEGVNASEIADKIISGDITGALHDTLVAAGVDPNTAKTVATSIEQAQKIVNDAFESLGISDEAQAKILEMQEAGASEGEIAKYIESLGVDPKLASEAASSIMSAGALVTGAVDKLPEDVQTSVSGLNFLDAQDTITASFAVLEVPLTVASPVVASCMKVRDFLSAQVGGIFDDIATVLTDGMPDSAEAIAGLEDKVRNWATEARKQIQAWYDDEVAKLNASGKTGAEYDQAMQGIKDRAEEMFDSVAETEADAIGFIGNMAGQSTAYVQAHLGELDDIEKRCMEVSGQIDALGVKMNEVEANAFKVVRAGGKADETTIQGAMNYVITEFNIDTQAAQDAYEQEVQRLDALFAEGKISKEAHDLGVDVAAARRDIDLKAAEDAFNQNFFELMRGIAEGEGVQDAFDMAMKGQELQINAIDFFDNVDMSTEEGEAASRVLAAQFSEVLGRAVDPDVFIKAFDMGGMPAVWEAIATLLGEAAPTLSKAQQEAFSGKVGQVFGAAVESGILKGTQFDTKNSQDQITALFEASISGAAEDATPAAEAAGESLVSSAVSGAGNSGSKGRSLGGDFGDGYANGILAKISKVKLAAQKLALAANISVKTTQDSSSPSKVARGLGNDFGDGYSIGIQESMANAAYVARRMTGGVISAAAEGQRMRVSNMPDLQQEIIMANELSTQPIDLYVNGRLLARAMATDTRNEQNRYNRSIALGVGQK